MFPIGFSVSASTRVGNLLGEGKGHMASFASRVNLCCAACASLVIGVMLMSTPHGFFPSLLAPREVDVIQQASKTIPLLAFYVFADGVQVCLNGIIKGCGRQWTTVPIGKSRMAIEIFLMVSITLMSLRQFFLLIGLSACRWHIILPL